LASSAWPPAHPATSPRRSGGDRNASPAKPALTVTVATPESRDMERHLAANGSIAAWQEASSAPNPAACA
jgi:hypothetical protein